jgi:molybdopterin/thiamine biosynthesis adenylyltransferase
MTERYSRNMKMLSPEENDSLKGMRVCVIGCGGLGGHIIEMLGRLGVGYITAVDGDVFEESNLNRQLLSSVSVIGKSKALTAKERMAEVNPLININPIYDRLTMENGREIIKDHHVVVDALDNVDSRLNLQDLCAELKIPLVHGAIAGWYGQVTTIFPEDRTLDMIYFDRNIKGLEKELGNPSFTPALVASIEVSEVLKILIGRGELLRKKLLHIDLLTQDYTVINL